jgi:hypothetical protein
MDSKRQTHKNLTTLLGNCEICHGTMASSRGLQQVSGMVKTATLLLPGTILDTKQRLLCRNQRRLEGIKTKQKARLTKGASQWDWTQH